MRHVPHMVIGAPWPDDKLSLSVMQWRHLTKVLRMGRGDQISYTDGLGTVGVGRLGDKEVIRGDEDEVPQVSDLVVAVAPPSSKDRQRFVVEKLAELGVSTLVWLKTAHGKDRLVSPAKTFAWTLSAVEQSRGAWLMEISAGLVDWVDLEPPVVVCHPGGSRDTPRPRTVVIGPEGGFSEEEIPETAERWDLGPTTLRVETAALIAAARIM
ncbi:MAG: RsmE family RNA methyltransferase [Actinomycetota bacterium]|nr:RsmE family RNA methyltransferase [Actinomycetota bacterium]